MSAKLFVPAGGFFHSSAGDLFSPVQPMMLPAFFCSMLPPLLNEVLVSAKGAARRRAGRREQQRRADSDDVSHASLLCQRGFGWKMRAQN